MQLPAAQSIRPDERILILGLPASESIAELSGRLAEGGLVVGVEGDAVYQVRRAARDFDNVMVVPAEPGVLPWADGFFTRAFDLADAWPREELERVTQGTPHG